MERQIMDNGALGKVYRNGDTIVHQGDAGDCMYVIQAGEVEVVRSQNGSAVRLAVLGQGDIFGELSLFGNDKRTATVRALGDARIMTVDKNIFLRRIQEDLTLAFRIFQTMAARLNDMNAEMAVLKSPV
jgi:CRP-like cAMP-binding protein